MMNEKFSSSIKSKYQRVEKKTQRVVVRSARNPTPLSLNSPGGHSLTHSLTDSLTY